MSRTIADLSGGTIVYLDETVEGTLSHVPFIYLGKDESGNCILLRQYAAIMKRMHATNEAVYDGCEADLYLEDEETGYLSRFDEATRMALVATQIKCNNIASSEVVSIARRCFLLSYTELGYATEPDEGASFLEALKTATGQTNANTARVCYNELLVTVYWWMRSAASGSQFRSVSAYGYALSGNASVASNWLRPALAVSPDTIVSSDTEDTIYLLPDPAKTYREVDATINIGTSAKRPSKVRVMVSAENCSTLELKVSNNAKDTSPVWVEVENGGVADLPNETKETENWEIGVHIYARSNGKAVIGEPVILAVTE